MRLARVAATVGASLVLGGGSGTTASSSGSTDGGTRGASNEADDPPPAISRAAYKRLKLGTTRATVFARFGRSDFAEGPSPATSKVLADRCYIYAVEGEPFTESESPSWWLCFDGTAPGSKLVTRRSTSARRSNQRRIAGCSGVTGLGCRPGRPNRTRERPDKKKPRPLRGS